VYTAEIFDGEVRVLAANVVRVGRTCWVRLRNLETGEEWSERRECVQATPAAALEWLLCFAAWQFCDGRRPHRRADLFVRQARKIVAKLLTQEAASERPSRGQEESEC
jgi:hypothetical protein